MTRSNLETKCHFCGGEMKFSPENKHLQCLHCGSTKEIVVAQNPIEESNFFDLNFREIKVEQLTEIHVLNCTKCGATTSLNSNIVSDCCPFCTAALVVNKEHTQKIIKPSFLLPFVIEDKVAKTNYQSWLSKRWFAPNDLKLKSSNLLQLRGIYTPYWTFDAETTTDYTGQRGINRREHYTTTENGKTVTKTRTVTDWYYTSGTVYNSFDDIAILASNSLPKKYVDKLEPWDLQNLQSYHESFLAGFITELYNINIKDGFDSAKQIMKSTIDGTVRRDIGGDHQKVDSTNVHFNSVTYKHILLPIWLSSYNYKNKIYQIVVNGRTGEVHGERPYSWIKITLTILTGLALVAGLLFLLRNK